MAKKAAKAAKVRAKPKAPAKRVDPANATELAMAEAIATALKEGITDPAEIRGRMLTAREELARGR